MGNFYKTLPATQSLCEMNYIGHYILMRHLMFYLCVGLRNCINIQFSKKCFHLFHSFHCFHHQVSSYSTLITEDAQISVASTTKDIQTEPAFTFHPADLISRPHHSTMLVPCSADPLPQVSPICLMVSTDKCKWNLSQASYSVPSLLGQYLTPHSGQPSPKPAHSAESTSCMTFVHVYCYILITLQAFQVLH